MRPVERNRVPIAKKISQLLERHGLLFADALNLALFLLTIVSLVAAFLGVAVGVVTLRDARNTASEQKKQNEDASKAQQVEFAEQIRELRSSAQALDIARDLLTQQGRTLTSLQNISTKQLEDLNKAEARANARPLPHLRVFCQGIAVVDVIGGKNSYRRHSLSIYYDEQDDDIKCHAYVLNEGVADLVDASWELSVTCDSGPVEGLITAVDNTKLTPTSRVLLYSKERIQPESISDNRVIKHFTIGDRKSCGQITVWTDFTSKSFDNVATRSNLTIVR